ncbi:TPA: DNA methyltransferase [Streptococcus agalactiae]|nr:DNA methyltransferase [Streptococcus agalactiae]
MSDTKMTVWALFDSGNGSYTKGVTALNSSGGANIDIYPVGIDIENKNNHFINLNLADYNRLFGDNTLFDELDKLPKPDLIIASPPCESWSNASAMSEGNACWKQEDLSDSLFAPQREASMFTIRNNSDYDKAYINYQYDRQFMKRVNGELTAFNTIEIIKQNVEWKHFSKSYNERSNIPQNLVTDIFTKVYKKFLQEKQNDNQN